jgi:hypothetical protein
MAPPVLSPPPRWARVVDALTIAALAIAADVWLFGGMAISIGTARLSVRSPGRLLIAAAVLALIRHARVRYAPLHVRFAHGAVRIARSAAMPVAGAALVSRAAIILVGFFAVLTFGLSTPEVGFTLADDPLLNLPARFDAGWYGTIAQDGYSFSGRFDRQQNIAFFPAFPMLMRGAGAATGGFAPGIPKPWRQARLLWGGVFVSIAAFAWACVYLFRLGRDLGLGHHRAQASGWLLAAYPFAAYFSAAYTEGLFLLGTVGAFYHFRRREWVRSAGWGLLVGLTRPNGCLLSVVLAVMAAEELWRARSTVPRYPLARAIASAAAPGIGMLLYTAYMKQLTGYGFAWARIQEAWSRSFEGLAPAERALTWVSTEGLLRVVSHLPFDAINAAAFLFALAMIWPIWRRLGPAWAVLVIINILPPFFSGGVLSMGRMTSTLFPIFVALAAMLPEAFITPFVLTFALGQGLVASLFFTWRPMF